MFVLKMLERSVVAEEFDDAISCWKESIALQPSSSDAHTSMSIFSAALSSSSWPLVDLASAYIVSPVSRPDLALHHLRYVYVR